MPKPIIKYTLISYCGLKDEERSVEKKNITTGGNTDVIRSMPSEFGRLTRKLSFNIGELGKYASPDLAQTNADDAVDLSEDTWQTSL